MHLRISLLTDFGKPVVEKTAPFCYGVAPFDVGMDNVSAVSDDTSPLPFGGA